MKKITIASFATILLLILQTVSAQAQFISTGRIAFEKRTNIKLQMTNEMGDQPGMSEWVKMLPQTISSYFNLYFTEEQTNYVFDKHEELKGMAAQMMGMSPGSENHVGVNIKAKSYTADKKFFESNFLIVDELPQYTWKIEDEVRVIAGYTCRKAVTRIMDSVVVVAFYTDEILCNGGPESFNGLPGMILGVAIPRLYTTWFATEVELMVPDIKVLAPPSKGKKVTFNELYEQMEKSMKQYGKYGEYAKWWVRV